MKSAINFAVRDGAGKMQLGSVAGEGQTNIIAVGQGQQISLNLSPGSVVSYQQKGNDLIVEMTDGRTIVLSGYFAAPADFGNKLYLSSNDEIFEVRVADGVDGVLFADYGPVQAMEKWSPLDGLRFSEADVLSDTMLASSDPAGMTGMAPGLAVTGTGMTPGAAAVPGVMAGGSAAALKGMGSTEPAGMAGLVPGLLAGGGAAVSGAGIAAAALAGGALLAGTGGSGSGSTVTPSVDTTTSKVITTQTTDPAIVVTGKGNPGDSVAVTVAGKTQTTTIGTDGTWTTTFTGSNLPPDGTYVPQVVVTSTTTGTTTTLTGTGQTVDMTPPSYEVKTGLVSTNTVHNAAALTSSNGAVVLTGTGEPGATMRITANGTTVTAVVGADGTWTASFTATQLPGGDFRQVPVQITSTDKNGNTSAVQNTLIAIDTVPNAIAVSTVAGDGVVNLAESTGGFTVTGTSVPGASLTVTLGTSTQTVTVGADGKWTATIPSGAVTQNGTTTLTLTSTDAAGNTNTVTQQITVDTTPNAMAVTTVAGDGIVNKTESTGGFTASGTSVPGAQLTVTIGSESKTVTVGADGKWSANFPGGLLTQDGTATMTLTSTDAAGNSSTITQQITVDTTPNAIAVTTVAGDGMVNRVESTGGFTASGTSVPGAQLTVTIGASSQTVTVGADGRWSANFAGGLLAQDGTATMTLTSTDAAGNSNTVTQQITVDTTPNPIVVTTMAGDNVVNRSESTGGFAVTGTSVPGAQLTVMIGSSTQVVTAGADGKWTANFPSGTVTQDGTATVTLSSTDAAGNPNVVTQQITVDTTAVANFTATQPFGTAISAGEAAAGVNITGKADPNSSVVVAFEGMTRTVTADAGGNWTANFSLSGLTGANAVDRNSLVVVNATDPFGNTARSEMMVRVDTMSPTEHFVVGDVGTGNLISGVLVANATDVVGSGVTSLASSVSSLNYFAVAATGSAQVIGAAPSSTLNFGREDGTPVSAMQINFANVIPDGTYVVIRDTDSAGNQNSTMYLRSTNEVSVDLTRAGLQGFDFGTINLISADANLTLNTARVLALGGVDKQITISGNADDNVDLSGGTDTGTTRVAHGETFKLYTLNSGASVWIDDDINVNHMP